MAESDGRVAIPLDYDQRHIAREVGGRWDGKAWRFLPTGATLFRLKCAGIRLSQALEVAANYFRRFRLEQLPPVPDCHTEPWPHQIEPTARAAAMDSILLHVIMGGGKTKIALDACRARGHRWILVLCPTHVGDVWIKEVPKHAPDMRLVNLTSGTVVDRAARIKQCAVTEPPTPLIFAINYEATWREPLAKTILSVDWDCLILDESHRIKGAASKQSRFAMRIRAGHKMALTGTPMPHSPLDLYGQYRTLDIGVFGPRNAEFKARYAELGPFHEVRRFVRQDELREKMDWLRVEVKQDALTLPPIQYLERSCVLGDRARKAYDELERDLITEVAGNVITVANALVKLLRLQQIGAGYLPRPYEAIDGRHVQVVDRIDDSKRQLLRELLEDLPQDRVVVFCRFRPDMKNVHEICEQLSRPSYEISGSRRDYLPWKECTNSSAVMVVQLQAGLGIDLTEAAYGIFYTLGFSLGDYQQCVARLHRPGQERATIIYHLLAKDTVDGSILKALGKKRDVIEYVLTGLRKGEGDDKE